MQKSTLQKKSRNSKLKEKYYINEKTHLATEKNLVLHHSLKINKQVGPNNPRGGSEKNRKINKRPPRLLET